MSIPVGASVARRGNVFSRWLAWLVLRLMGWRVQGAVPDVPKMILIGAPHTSNMDGFLALATLTALGLRAGTMIKDSAFKGAMGPLLRWFGAIPINRRSPKGVVEQSVDAFDNNDRLILLIAPEGTRSSAPEWKRGFYHIAASAKVPILAAGVHYGRKIITFGLLLTPGGDYAADLQRLLEFYREYGAPRHAERMSKPLCEVKGIAWQPRPDDD